MKKMVKMFLLIGCTNNSFIEDETTILGSYRNLKSILAEIKNYERDKQNYSCSKCDYGLNDEKITEKQFKERKCPECGENLEYAPKIYDGFEVIKMKLLSKDIYYKKGKWGGERGFEEGEMIYRCKCNPILSKFDNLNNKREKKHDKKLNYA